MMNIQEMMKQAQVMQQRMQDIQARLGELEVTGQAGGGMVKITMNCKGEVRGVELAPEIIIPDDKETLEDLIKAAYNMARQNADETMASETRRMMEEFGLPADFQLPL